MRRGPEQYLRAAPLPISTGSDSSRHGVREESDRRAEGNWQLKKTRAGSDGSVGWVAPDSPRVLGLLSRRDIMVAYAPRRLEAGHLHRQPSGRALPENDCMPQDAPLEPSLMLSSDCGLPPDSAESASALPSLEARSALTRVTACMLARSPIGNPPHQRLHRVRCLPRRSDCYRLELQLPGGVCTRWGRTPSHGALNRRANPCPDSNGLLASQFEPRPETPLTDFPTARADSFGRRARTAAPVRHISVLWISASFFARNCW